MATFACIHGAGGWGSDWDLVAAELEPRGHEVVGVDLPCEQEVGLGAHVQAVVDAVNGRSGDLVVVGQSLGGFVASLVPTVVPVSQIVLLAAMVPSPGETAGEWWDNTGHAAAYAAQGLVDESPEAVFLHDVPASVLSAAQPPRDQAAAFFADPWPLSAWPDVPTSFIVCRDDRFFPAAWLTGVVKDRLGIEPIEIPGGHCAYHSQPRAVADALDRCWTAR